MSRPRHLLLALISALILTLVVAAPVVARTAPTHTQSLLGLQGAIHPPVASGYWYRAGMDLEPYYGQHIRVALLDTGVQCSLPGLGGAVSAGKNFSSARIPDPCYDGFGHGTHTAGLIHAACPSCHITSYKILHEGGSGTEHDLANAIRQAVLDHNQIISMSVAGYQFDPSAKRDIAWARANGVLVFAASSNDGMLDQYGAVYPASYPGVLRIAACTSMATPLAAGEAGALLAAGVSPQAVPGLMEQSAVKMQGANGWHVGYGNGHEGRALLLAWRTKRAGPWHPTDSLVGAVPPVEPLAPATVTTYEP